VPDIPKAHLPKQYLPRSKLWTIYDLDKREVARQISLIEIEIFIKIKPHELLRQEWATKNKSSLAKNVRNMVSFSTKVIHVISNNQMSEWIIRSILEENDARQRSNILRFFIRVCGVSLCILIKVFDEHL
jgi:hypothetical protein